MRSLLSLLYCASAVILVNGDYDQTSFTLLVSPSSGSQYQSASYAYPLMYYTEENSQVGGSFPTDEVYSPHNKYFVVSVSAGSGGSFIKGGADVEAIVQNSVEPKSSITTLKTRFQMGGIKITTSFWCTPRSPFFYARAAPHDAQSNFVFNMTLAYSAVKNDVMMHRGNKSEEVRSEGEYFSIVQRQPSFLNLTNFWDILDSVDAETDIDFHIYSVGSSGFAPDDNLGEIKIVSVNPNACSSTPTTMLTIPPSQFRETDIQTGNGFRLYHYVVPLKSIVTVGSKGKPVFLVANNPGTRSPLFGGEFAENYFYITVTSRIPPPSPDPVPVTPLSPVVWGSILGGVVAVSLVALLVGMRGKRSDASAGKPLIESELNNNSA